MSTTVRGVLAALGISLTSGVAYPFVKHLDQFTIEELMLSRGGFTAVFVVLFFGRHLSRPNRHVLGYALCFAGAIYCGYNGARVWNVNLLVALFSTFPLVNFAFKWLRGETVSRATILAAITLITGATLAIRPWDGATFSVVGVTYGTVATVLVGVAFELIKASTATHWSTRVTTLAIMLCVFALASVHVRGAALLDDGAIITANNLAILIVFGLVSGFGYFFVVNVAVDNLPTEVAAVISITEAPVMVFVAWLLLGETLTPVQGIGLTLALGATTAFSILQAKNGENT